MIAADATSTAADEQLAPTCALPVFVRLPEGQPLGWHWVTERCTASDEVVGLHWYDAADNRCVTVAVVHRDRYGQAEIDVEAGDMPPPIVLDDAACDIAKASYGDAGRARYMVDEPDQYVSIDDATGPVDPVWLSILRAAGAL